MTTTTLEFPFASVDRAAMVFGGIPNYDKVVRACPSEFKDYHRNPWSEVAGHMFFFGVKDSEQNLFRFKASDKAVVSAQMAYMRTWLGSYDPPHEVKMAVCGWLLSLMLEEPPALTR